ncbi:MAG: hypothetical protein ABSH48_12075 [Verrucomicrobiota bacterium]
MSGLGLGLFFHRENWLGGYGSFKRRMYRLAHISFFGLGAVNLLFWLTLSRIATLETLATVVTTASWAFIVGGIAMPLCCVVMAHFPKAHLIFAVPVVSLILGGVLTLAILTRDSHPGPVAAGPAPNSQSSATHETHWIYRHERRARS